MLCVNLYELGIFYDLCHIKTKPTLKNIKDGKKNCYEKEKLPLRLISDKPNICFFF